MRRRVWPTLWVAAVIVALMAAACSAPGSGPPGGGGPLDPRGIPKRFVPLLHAAGGRYCDPITAPALAGQIRQESGWDPNAGSRAGAQGLAQFTPGTWAAWGRDANHNGTNSPFDPADAIDAQARFMCALAQQAAAGKASGRLRGDVLDLAWAGYNAGFGAVQQFGGIPPYPETQNYVVSVRRYMQGYEQQPPAPEPPKGSGGWVNPLGGQSYVLSSGFGGRGAPCAGCSSMHLGQDMATVAGTPIKAACTGPVLAATFDATGMGNATAIACGGGVRTYYAHQSKQVAHTGDHVKAGQVIGYVGSTGHSTGPHLHFEVHTGAPAPGLGGWYAGTPVDPVPFMRKHGAPL